MFTCLFFDVTAHENSEDNEKKEDEYFEKIYQQSKGVKAKDNVDSTYKVIPKFYFKVLLVFCSNQIMLCYQL